MLKSYLKLALKVLLRRKFFTFISLFGISFTLLVLMVATAMLDHVFAPRSPETRADRTLLVMHMGMRGPHGSRNGSAGYGFLDRYARNLPGAERVAIASQPNLTATYHDGRKIRIFLRRTDGEFWRVLDFDFVEGGPFLPEDEHDANRVAVINEATRERFFGDSPGLGRTIEVDQQEFRVVGVVRNVPITRFVPFADVWVPISTSRSEGYKRELVGDYVGLILARSRADLQGLRADFQTRLGEVQFPDSEFDTLHGGAETLFEAVSRDLFSQHGEAAHAARLRMIMLGAMLLFMLLPTVNLININLSRILERASEIGVRKAFGASSGRLVGQFVVENVVLSLLGAVIGLLLAALALGALNRSGLIPYSDFQLNWRVFGYGLLLTVFFGVLSGVYPAWRMSRLHPVQALRGRSA